VNEITVARDRAADTLAEVSRAIERLLNRFHGKVCVASVDDLEECDLGITSKVNILRDQYSFLYCLTISYESYKRPRMPFSR
jgi:hypothetical protein